MTVGAPSGATSLVLRDVNVVDTGDGSISAGMDVTVRDGLIAAITPTGGTGPSEGKVVEAAGRFVVPGLLDMHAHPLGEKKPTGGLELMLANGVTGFRQMSGSADLLRQRAAGTLPMPQDSPTVAALPGGLLTPLNAGTVEDAVAAVREQHAAGADFVKVGLVSPEVFFPVQQEAGRLGIPLAGHLPVGIDVFAVSRGGMRCIEHLGPGVAILAECSSDREGLAEAVASFPTIKRPSVKLPMMDKVLTAVLRRIVVNPIGRSKPEAIAVMQRAVDTFDDERAAEMAARFVADGTWQCPTLIRERTQYMCDAAEFRDDPNLGYMSPSTVMVWERAADRFAKFSPQSRATFRAVYDVLLRLTKIFDDAGVPMIAGSDAVGAAWEVPGFSLHQELDELARAGLTPLRVLQMTTSKGAEFLGLTSSLGSVEVGKNAELVLLGGNPVESVSNLHKVDGVIQRGRHYSSSDLADIKARVRTVNPAT